ncbi:AAA domain-containing protein [Carboxydocella thermautotrophica]|nr:AAA domain-containing protein [Carboxydocella thermautotrophica]
MSDFRKDVYEMIKALDLEISQLQQKGAKYRINDGQFLKETNQCYTYQFLLADEITLPDGSPVRLVYKNKTVYGEVLAIEGFDITIELSDYIGDVVEEAELYCEPWNILKELKNRLQNIINSKKNGLCRLVLYGDGKNILDNDIYQNLQFKNVQTELAARAYYNKTTYIWGPPGTGKTYNLAKVTDYCISKNCTVLLLSHSNAAVDGLVYKIYEQQKNVWTPGKIVRFGVPKLPELLKGDAIITASQLVEHKYPKLKKEKEKLFHEQQYLRKKVKSGNATKDEKEKLAIIEDKLKEIRKNIRLLEDEYINKAQVLGVTLSKAALNSLIYNRKFDVVIVDEASMAYIPYVVFAASLAKKSVVVCGDFKQLPPIAIGQHELIERWLKRDIFEQAGIVKALKEKGKHPNMVMLVEQRRMHKDIAYFASKNFYDDKLANHRSVKSKQSIANSKPFPGNALVLIDLDNLGAYGFREWDKVSRFNVFSAFLSIFLIIKATKEQNISIGYISPFNAQARLVSALLLDLLPDIQQDKGKRIIAATVHKFQGSERDIIIYDVVESFPQKKASILINGHETDRLVNVAVTRARGKLINIADTNFLRSQLNQNNPTLKLIFYIMKNGEVINWLNIKEILKGEQIQGIEWYIDTKEEVWIKEIMKAKNEIIIFLPNPNTLKENLRVVLEDLEKKLSIYILTNEPEKITGIKFINIQRDCVASFIIIDRKIIIYGAPKLHPTKLVIKACSPRAAKLLVNFLGIYDNNFSVQREIAVTKEGALARELVVKPAYSLKKYVEIWANCSQCGKQVIPQLIYNNKIVLVCTFCGKHNKITVRLLKKYLEHTNLKCKTCLSFFEAKKGKFGPYLECRGCGKRLDINSLW